MGNSNSDGNDCLASEASRPKIPSVDPKPPLVNDIEADVCVVGGGLSGLSTALHLAELGFEHIVVLEATVIGAGATGASAGHIVPGFVPSPARIARITSKQTARELFETAEWGKCLLRETISRLSIDCDFRNGYLLAGLNEQHSREMEETTAFWRSVQPSTGFQFLSKAEMPRYIASEFFHCGIYDPGGGSLDPGKLLRGICQHAIRLGVVVYETTPAVDLQQAPGHAWHVIAEHGRVRAPDVVICVNAFPNNLDARAAALARPVRTSVLVTEQLPSALLNSVLPGGCAVSDWRDACDYFHARPDGRFLFGGELESPPGDQKGRDIRYLEHRMAELFPTLNDAPVEQFWQMDVDVTHTRLPCIGPVGRHLWIATGYNGMGLVLSFAAGSAIASAINGNFSDIKAFRKIPFYR